MKQWRKLTPYGRSSRLMIAVSLIVAASTLASCTGQDEGTPEEPARDQPASWKLQMNCEYYAPAQISSEVLTGEEFLAGIHEADLEVAEALIYPNDHPQAGKLMPFGEWQSEQVSAWGKYITRENHNLRDMMTAVYDLMIEEVSPDEFRATVHEGKEERISSLFYPADHPEGGEFIPSTEWQMEQQSAWEHYLISRPDDAGCPYGDERFPGAP